MDMWHLKRVIVTGLVVACVAGCATVKDNPDQSQATEKRIVKVIPPSTFPPYPCNHAYNETLTWRIFFDPQSSKIKDMYRPEFQKLLNMLSAYPEMKIKINGYDDDLEVRQKGLLSQARAEVIMNALVKDYGIDPNRMSAQGYGYVLSPNMRLSADPKAREAVRALTRRVEVRNDESVPVLTHSCIY